MDGWILKGHILHIFWGFISTPILTHISYTSDKWFCLTLFHYRLMGPMLRLATYQVSGCLGFHGMPWFTTSSRNKRRLALGSGNSTPFFFHETHPSWSSPLCFEMVGWIDLGLLLYQSQAYLRSVWHCLPVACFICCLMGAVTKIWFVRCWFHSSLSLWLIGKALLPPCTRYAVIVND
jgi:hypothetical protein